MKVVGILARNYEIKTMIIFYKISYKGHIILHATEMELSLMDLKYCKRCNHIYKYGDENICSDCIKEIDAIMRKVRNFLDENPDADVSEISEGIQENEKDILYLLREGRLSIKSEAFCCLRCGKPIENGKYCAICVKQMKTQLNGVVNDYKNNTKNSGNKFTIKDKNTGPKKGENYAYYTRKDQ